MAYLWIHEEGGDVYVREFSEDEVKAKIDPTAKIVPWRPDHLTLPDAGKRLPPFDWPNRGTLVKGEIQVVQK